MPMQAGTKDSNDLTRFGFGRNWQQFSSFVSEERIAEAEKSFQDLLICENLQGCRFLDMGSGSELFSLAAVQL